jgi:hypothetical protein
VVRRRTAAHLQNKETLMRRLWSLAVVLAIVLATAPASAKDVVVVYTALEPEQIT